MGDSEHDETRSRWRASVQTDRVGHFDAASGPEVLTLPAPASLMPTLLRGKVGGRGSLPLRAATMQSMQRTHGNRAVQRYLSAGEADGDDMVQVQRFELTEALDNATSASEWLNPFTIPARASQRISDFANQQSTQNPDAGAWDITKGVFNAEQQHEQESAASVRKAEETFGHGVEWAEGKISGGAHWLADQVEGVPGLGDSARRGAATVSDYAQIGTGVLKGAGTLVGGVAQMAANPIGTIEGLGAMAEHVPTMSMMGLPNPLKMAHAGYDVLANDKPFDKAYDSVFNPLISQHEDNEFFTNMGKGLLESYTKAAERGRIGEVMGRGAFDIGSLFIGAGEARGAAEAGQITKGLEGAEAAASTVRGMEGAELVDAALRGVEGAEATGSVTRGATAAETGLAHGSPTLPTVPAPVELPALEATRSPVPDVMAFDADEVTQVIRRDALDTIPNSVANEATIPNSIANETTIPNQVAHEATLRNDLVSDLTLPDDVTSNLTLPHDFANEATIRHDLTSDLTLPNDISNEVTLPNQIASEAPTMREVPAQADLGPALAGNASAGKSASYLDKALDAFKKLIGDDVKLKDAPAEVALPDELSKGMQEAWDSSRPGSTVQEQGGIFVQNKDGSFEWKPAPGGTSDSIAINYGDVGPGQKSVGTGHTHPYPDGTADIGFSRQDLSSMIWEKERFGMVQSGESQYMSAKTNEFDARVQGLDDAGKQAMKAEMEARWHEVFQDARAQRMTFEECVRTANQTVHMEYDLLYYEGQGGLLQRN